MDNIKTYSELSKLKTFKDRYKYLRLGGFVGTETFGFARYLNQKLYQSREWRRARDSVILRDNGCDLGVDGYDIFGTAYIHHINPITKDQILNRDSSLFDPENLITVSYTTHQAIHYGDESLIVTEVVERTPGDMKLW